MDLLTLLLVIVLSMCAVYLVTLLPAPWRLGGIVVLLVVIVVAILRLTGIA